MPLVPHLHIVIGLAGGTAWTDADLLCVTCKQAHKTRTRSSQKRYS